MSPLLRQPLTVEHALLGFLHQKPMHGYEVYRLLVDPAGLGLVWQVKQSHLYAMLDRLEGAGYIAGTLQAQDVRPPRRVLQLTRAGRKAYRDWLSQPMMRGHEIRLEFMAKLFFAQQEGAGPLAQLIQIQREACEAWRGRLKAEAEATFGRSPFEWRVFQFRVRQIEATIEWLDQCCIAALDTGVPDVSV